MVLVNWKQLKVSNFAKKTNLAAVHALLLLLSHQPCLFWPSMLLEYEAFKTQSSAKHEQEQWLFQQIHIHWRQVTPLSLNINLLISRDSGGFIESLFTLCTSNGYDLYLSLTLHFCSLLLYSNRLLLSKLTIKNNIIQRWRLSLGVRLRFSLHMHKSMNTRVQ